VGKLRYLAIGAIAALSVAGGFAAPDVANAATYNFTGIVNGDQFAVTFSLVVSGGNAISGGGTISGGGLAAPEALTLITLASPGVENDGAGLLGYRSDDGTDWFDADTRAPIDGNGLIFAMGPGPVGFGVSQQFDVYSVGPNSYDGGLFGSAQAGVAPHFYAYNIPLNGGMAPVPEPSTWAMLMVGFGGLGFAAFRKGKGQRARALAA
jgi:PEP-CTERM motif-containing protein